jgi:DNA-binding PadR family transcriptional regulator
LLAAVAICAGTGAEQTRPIGGRQFAERRAGASLQVDPELGNDAYGGTIREAIEQRTGRVVSSGAINTTLGRLVDRQLVTWRLGEPTSGRAGRPRRYYAITLAGARALKASFGTIRAMAGGLTAKLNRLAEDER